jgi:hypothetical protein
VHRPAAVCPHTLLPLYIVIYCQSHGSPTTGQFRAINLLQLFAFQGRNLLIALQMARSSLSDNVACNTKETLRCIRQDITHAHPFNICYIVSARYSIEFVMFIVCPVVKTVFMVDTPSINNVCRDAQGY